MDELIPHEAEKGLSTNPQPTLEEMREMLLLAIRVSLKDASGLKDEEEFKLVWGRKVREITMMVDHLITLTLLAKEIV